MHMFSCRLFSCVFEQETNTTNCPNTEPCRPRSHVPRKLVGAPTLLGLAAVDVTWFDPTVDENCGGTYVGVCADGTITRPFSRVLDNRVSWCSSQHLSAGAWSASKCSTLCSDVKSCDGEWHHLRSFRIKCMQLHGRSKVCQ